MRLDGGDPVHAPASVPVKQPIAGTRLIREWQGVEHAVTVRDDDYEYRGAPYKSLSCDRPRHHRHALERLGLFRPQECASERRRLRVPAQMKSRG